MIRLTKKANCCGCGACAQSCPKNCISMEPDSEGFLYPKVDETQCVNCGLCEKVCPILFKQKPDPIKVAAYAAYTSNSELREKSSSGGIFSLLAQEILNRGGTVAGAAFAADFSVRHILVENDAELDRLRGSKYVQSRMEDTYVQIRDLLKQGRPVLFTGVACQIAGLKAFLGREYENLYTVDVLCHGVPSPKVWAHYRREQAQIHGTTLEEVSFRDKRKGWRHYSMALNFAEGVEYCRPGAEDTYLRVFLRDLCLRPSCHSCRFKDFPRLSDLTIGDAWGIERHMPDLDDDHGTSVVLVNSEKGMGLWNAVADNAVSRQGELDILLPKSADSRKSVKPHPNRSRFFAALNRGDSMEQLCKLTRKSPYRRLLSYGKRTVKRLLRK
jgi:coenzyme F420-reducing hydrogenase beta subunit